jgi:hypothetical protein
MLIILIMGLECKRGTVWREIIGRRRERKNSTGVEEDPSTLHMHTHYIYVYVLYNGK